MGEPAREISQRELRNDSGSILREVEQGARFIVTRNGNPIAELHPLRRKPFVGADALVALFGADPAIDADRFFDDLDQHLDQAVLRE